MHYLGQSVRKQHRHIMSAFHLIIRFIRRIYAVKIVLYNTWHDSIVLTAVDRIDRNLVFGSVKHREILPRSLHHALKIAEIAQIIIIDAVRNGIVGIVIILQW